MPRFVAVACASSKTLVISLPKVARAALEATRRPASCDRDLERLTTRLEQSPNDHAAKAQLGQVVSEASKTQLASPVTITNLARAHAALGNQAQAAENVDKALRINPNLAPALILKNKMNMATVAPH
jgi:hypothetical protein